MTIAPRLPIPPHYLLDEAHALALDPGRPLILCDADEVLFYMIRALEAFLETRGCRLNLVSYRINGNVLRKDTGATVADDEVWDLLGAFFTEATEVMEAVEDAAAALARLSDIAQVVILTNLPAPFGAARARRLHACGMPYPVVTNSGLKGHAIARLVAGMAAPVVFIDDTPPHLKSAAEEAAHVHRLHFVADPRLWDILGPSEHAHAHATDWLTAEKLVAAGLSAG